MISIVVSSYRESLFQDLKANIAATIGATVVYELIQIKNPGIMSACAAYNEGLDRCKHPYVLFLHEDLSFHTSGWGATLLEIFKSNEQIGLVGIAGGLYKTKAPSAWWEIADKDKYVFVRHGNKENNELMSLGFDDQKAEHITNVLLIDGLFIGLKKSTKLRFNERLKGYHQYDLGISIDACRKGYKAVCTDLIGVTHFSMGKIDKDWILSADNFFKQYARHLPLAVPGSITRRALKALENKSYEVFIHRALQVNLKNIAWKYWWQFFKRNPFSKTTRELLKIIRYHNPDS